MSTSASAAMSPAAHTPTPVDEQLASAVRVRLAETAAEPTPARVAAALRAEGVVLGDIEVLALTSTLRADLAGAGPLEPLLRLPDVTDVLVNGPSEVWVDTGDGLTRTAITFRDESAVRRLAQRLAAAAGRRLDVASPYVDARMADGTRLHAVLPPVSPEGTCISLRITRRRTFTFVELVASGTLTDGTASLLDALVRARLAFLVSGGTGTGKTTLLSTLLGHVDPAERVVLVEDSGELAPAHPHVVRLEARPRNAEGAGAVVLADLVRQALRMRPDRLVVGEVRSVEVVDLLAALNTGHEGGCGTIHANAAVDVPARVEALAVAAGLSRAAVHSQLVAALDVLIHLVRDRRTGVRRVAEVCVLDRDSASVVHALPAITISPDGTLSRGPGAEALQALLARRGETW